MRLRPALSLAPVLLLAWRPAAAADASTLASSLGQMLLGLAVVVGLLLASLWLLKQVTAPRGGAGALKVLGAVPVGTRERVVLVEVAGKVLVLGVAPGQVTALHSLDATELPGSLPAGGAGKDHDLRARLGRFVEGRK